jgi:hypothetical protein
MGTKAAATRVLTTISASDVDEHRELLCMWATDNGLIPENMASAPGLTIERTGRRTVIAYAEFQRDDQGRIMVDPADPDIPWTIPRTTPLVRPLSDYDGLAGLTDGHDQ